MISDNDYIAADVSLNGSSILVKKGGDYPYRTFLTNCNIMIGSGIITLPYFMLQTGVPLGLTIFGLNTVICTLAIYVI